MLQNDRMFEVGMNLWRLSPPIPRLSVGSKSHVEGFIHLLSSDEVAYMDNAPKLEKKSGWV